MEAIVDRYDPVRLWFATVGALVLTLVGGVLLFPARVFDEFIWQYLWGPVVADAHGASTAGCAVLEGGEVDIYYAGAECAAATGVAAHPGYTTLSTVTYALILLLALVGVVLLLRRMDAGTDRGFFYALFPFMLFGGALRVVEDANATLFRESGEMLLSLPWIGFLISPLIYFTVFAIALLALVASLWGEERGLVSRYEYPVFAIGTALLVGTLAFFGYLTVTTNSLGFYPAIPIITLGGATLITALVWIALQRYWPAAVAGTGFMGALVIWGHTVDGVANVLSLDWAHAVGLPGGYAPKHVVNRLIIDVTSSVQPAAVSEAIGTAWPFLFVKVGVAVLVCYLFEPEFFEESPRYAMLLLVAILAVGLGPGTRDFLRATFGI